MERGRIRVLVTDFAPIVSSSTNAVALAGMAAALRAELDIVTVKSDSLPHLERLGVARIFRVPVTGSPEGKRAMFCRAVARQIEAQPYDVIHVRGAFEGDVAAAFRKQLGHRLIYEFATFPSDPLFAHVDAEWRAAYTRCLEQSDLVLVPTRYAAARLRDEGFRGEVAVIPHGVDVNAFDWWPRLQSDETRILYVGPLTTDREPEVLLRALQNVSKTHPIRVLFAGEGDADQRQKIRAIGAEYGLDEKLLIRGEPNAAALPSLISAADIGIVPAARHPRYFEFGDMPQPLLEYMACRRCVVAADVPGVFEVIRDRTEGLLYTSGDSESLSQQILAAIESTELRESLVDSAYDRARRQFSGAARRRRLAECYSSILPAYAPLDPWKEAFDTDATGQIVAPPELFGETESGGTASDFQAPPTLVHDGALDVGSDGDTGQVSSPPEL